MANVSFDRDHYTVAENDGPVVVRVLLAGDITFSVTAR